MVTFDCSASHHDGVTLVTVFLRDLETSMRVTVRNCLDGPVWPPRTEGLPETGWTATGFSGVLPPGSHALGYATPAQPDGTPAELADAVVAPDATPVGAGLDSPADVVRELGDPSPPADAVPATDPSTPPTSAETALRDHGSRSSPIADSDGSATPPAPHTAKDSGATATHGSVTDTTTGDYSEAFPPELGPWIAEMTRRVDRAVALAEADTVPEATSAVREVGGREGVQELANAGDERQLRLVARRASQLADQRAAATIPVETLTKIT